MTFQTALAAGYSIKKILGFLSKSYPQLGQRFQQAAAAGYTAEQVFEMLNKTDIKNLSQFRSKSKGKGNEATYDNPWLTAEENYQNTAPEGLKTGVKLAAGALGAYALSRVAPQVAGQMAPEILGEGLGSEPLRNRPNETVYNPNNPLALPQDQKQLPYEPPPEGAMTTPYNPYEPKPKPVPPDLEGREFAQYKMAEGDRAKTEPLPRITPEKPAKFEEHNNAQVSKQEPKIPEKKAESEIKGKLAKDVIDRLGIEHELRQVASEKSNTNEDVAAYFEHLRFTPEQKKLLKGLTKSPFHELIGDYLAENPIKNSDTTNQKVDEAPKTLEREPQEIRHTQPPEEKAAIKQELRTKETPQEPRNENTVMLPNGDVGKIISEKDGIAKIEVDGEIKHRKLDEVEKTLFTRNELADSMDAVKQATPPELWSTAITLAHFDAENNHLQVMWHGTPNIYTYEIDDLEDIKKLKEGLVKAKGLTENYWGVRHPGEQSVAGAAVFDIAEKYRKRSGKKYHGKSEELHFQYRPAEKAAIERRKEEQKALKPKKKK